MTVKIVTDSVADLPDSAVEELGITVVPLLVCFGDETYRENVDMTAEQFYRRLTGEKTSPESTVDSPQTYAQVYDRLAEETDEILVITVSSKISNAYDTASIGIRLMKNKCRVEVLDSRQVTMAQGFVVMEAARKASTGADLDSVIDTARRTIPRVEMRASFDTLKYLRRGRRIGGMKALWGLISRIQPMIMIEDGAIRPADRMRSRKKAIDYLYNFAASYSNIEQIAVEYFDAAGDAEALMGRLGAIFPEERIYRSVASPVIGTHTGPNHLILSILGDREA